MIEAAIVATLLAGLLYLGFHFVPLFINMTAVVDAARNGVRAAAQQGSLGQGCLAGISDAQQRLQSSGILKNSHITVTTTPAGSYVANSAITMTVQATIPLIWGLTYTYSASSSDTILPQRSHWPLPPGVPINRLCTT